MKLTLLLIPLIFLSSCTIDWNDEKDKKIAELEKQVTELKEEIKKVKDDELFKKNKECSVYLKKMEDSNAPDSNYGSYYDSLVLYSPLLKTCIYAYSIHFDNGGSKGGEYFGIKNILSNEDIFQLFPIPGKNEENRREFYKKIESLK